jgi:hypothetical protein
MSEDGTVVVGHHWYEGQNELSYVTRSIAGAASRWGRVSVLAPGPRGLQIADGAFDVEGMGEQGAYHWPDTIPPGCVVVVDELVPEVAANLAVVGPRPVFYLSSHAEGHDPSWQKIPLFGNDASRRFVKAYIPVNPLAQLHRHNGFGFTGYQLVLSGQTPSHEDPPAAVAWLTAAFPESYVVVVENAVASAWKARTLRGSVSVDSRMDLWRLMAHASVCIDLAPGPDIARECVEALRFGTPIVVTKNSGAGAAHAEASGGATFADAGGLVEAVASLQVEVRRSRASDAGRKYAAANYGSPASFMDSLRELLSGT